jgi:hypothetical protein
MRMVMAETQRSPEFCSIRRCACAHLQIRQDSAACVSLSSNHFVKEHPVNQRSQHAARLAPFRRDEDETLDPDRPGWPRIKPEIAAHWFREPVHRPRGSVNSINQALLSTPINPFFALDLA